MSAFSVFMIMIIHHIFQISEVNTTHAPPMKTLIANSELETLFPGLRAVDSGKIEIVHALQLNIFISLATIYCTHLTSLPFRIKVIFLCSRLRGRSDV